MTEVRIMLNPPAIAWAHPDDRQRGFSEACNDGTLFVVCSEDGEMKPFCRDAPAACGKEAFVVLIEFPDDVPPGVSPHSNAAVLYSGQRWEIPHKFNHDQLAVRDQEDVYGPGVPGLERASPKTISECGGDVWRALALHNQTEVRRLDPAKLVSPAAAWLPRGPMPEADDGHAVRRYLLEAARAAWKNDSGDDDGEQRTFALIALGAYSQRARGRACSSFSDGVACAALAWYAENDTYDATLPLDAHFANFFVTFVIDSAGGGALDHAWPKFQGCFREAYAAGSLPEWQRWLRRPDGFTFRMERLSSVPTRLDRRVTSTSDC